MSDRTTINIDKETHSEASEVKEQVGDTWPEVLEWYANNRDGKNGDSDVVDTGWLKSEIESAIAEIEVEVDRSDTEKTAEVLVDRLMQRLKEIDEDVENAAYRGAKEAVEEVAR